MPNTSARSIILIALFWAKYSNAAFLGDLEKPVHLKEALFEASFISPNELHPRDAQGIVGNAPHGVYISVGIERGFMGAAASPDVSHLLFLDSNPTVIFFNRVNTMLLALSENLEDYRWLRFHSSLEDWRQRAISAGLDSNERRLLDEAETFVYWRKLILKKAFNTFHTPSLSLGYFEGMNYLFDDGLYGRLKTMARAGRIASVTIDLKKEGRRFSEIVQRLARLKLKLSVMDLSNAWYPYYVGLPATWKLWAESETIFQPSSVLMLVGENGRLGWSYLGFTAGKLSEVAYYKAASEWLERLTDEGGIIPDKIPESYAGRLDPELEIEAELPVRKIEFVAAPSVELPPFPSRFTRFRSGCADLLRKASRSFGPD